MMRAYVGFDDTDNLDADRGTGKLARWFEKRLPEGCGVWGVVRQQLLVHESIPYTSHNSSACVVVEMEDSSVLPDIVSRAVSHIEEFALEGSDPGLCVACENDPGLQELIDFGRMCTSRVLAQKDAVRAARGMHLSGHGGTRDGIIGAAAAVGLTVSGWSGRFIEYRNLRGFPETLKVSDLHSAGITVVSLDRDGQCPAPEELVRTRGWLRPRLWGGRPVLPVMPDGTGVWESQGGKRGKKKAETCLAGSGA